MRVYRSVLSALVAVTLGAAPAWAQRSSTVEATPYIAIGSGGAPPVGAAVVLPVTSALSIEVDVARRRGEGDINALSTNASLLWSLPRIGRSTPFVGAGIGLAQYGAPVLSSGGSPIGTQSRLAPTINIGGGMKMPLNENISLRTDARWFKLFGTPPGQGSEQFRVAQGVSLSLGRR